MQKHFDFKGRQGGTVFRCVAWNMAGRLAEIQNGTGEVCIAFTPKVNEWNGYSRIELQIVDIKPGAAVALK